ncbi:MAG: MFS transporter, partial [Bacteroidota bacterium]
MREKLGNVRTFGYALGMLGYSILVNIISVMLIYVYVPPENSGLIPLTPQITVLGVFTLLSLVVASGRLFDAITDPLVAFLSDRSRNKFGRRIPFMAIALLPSAVLCVAIFIPFQYSVSSANLWWLAILQILFYLSLTVYIVPYNALLPELAWTAADKVYLSAWLSVGFVAGIIFSSQTPLLADYFEQFAFVQTRNEAIQWSIGSLSLFAMLCMISPLFAIRESRHCLSKPISIPLGDSLKQTLRNRNFLLFVLSEAFYFVAITIVVSGLLYFLRVLLGLEESLGGYVMGTMVLVSLVYYPFVQKLSNRFGKKNIILFCFAYLGLLLAGVYFMGRLPIPPKVQIFGFAILASLPLAFLGILPYAIVAELAEKDGMETGQQKEAMFFAVRNLANKFGQTFGIMIFAILTLFGK